MRYIIIAVLLIFTLGFAQDAVAPKAVPIEQYNNLAQEYRNLQQLSDSYMKRMVQAQDANTILRQTISNLASDLIQLQIVSVDSVLKVYGIARR